MSPLRRFAPLLIALLVAPGLAVVPAGPALAEEAGEVEAAFDAARARLARGDLDGAVDGFAEVLRLDPEHRSARRYLAEVLHASDRGDEARAIEGGADPAVVLGAQGGSGDDARQADVGQASPEPDPGAEGPEPPPAVAELPMRTPDELAAAREELARKRSEAAARLEGDGEAAADPAPAPEPAEAPAASAPRRSRNPRGDRLAAAGLGLGGTTVGLGGFIELRPHWVLALRAGGGGSVLRVEGETRGLGAVSGEVFLLPVPAVVTPLFGVGVTALASPDAWRLDPLLLPLAATTDLRLYASVSLGLRFDLPGGALLEASAALVPSTLGSTRLVPLPLPVPGLRFGGRF